MHKLKEGWAGLVAFNLLKERVVHPFHAADESQWEN